MNLHLKGVSVKNLPPLSDSVGGSSSITGDLADILGVEVNLVEIKTIDTVFSMQIFSEGKLLDCQDENEFVKQQMKAYSMYVTLNEQRAEIFQNINERGSVFGE
ncbi:hypothetical protein [Solibacillus sp. FSL K6-1523]|uniref:hypothetical protein n=1 Tax=Solibacillus sp. FSL K6-1523 TaxID=2921471 RepID=UPI0030F58221